MHNIMHSVLFIEYPYWLVYRMPTRYYAYVLGEYAYELV